MEDCTTGCCCSCIVEIVVDEIKTFETDEDSSVDKICVERLTIVGGGGAVKTGNII